MKKQRGRLLVLVLLLLAACSTVPITGRRQLDLVPAAEVLSMSSQQYTQFLQSHKLSSDANATSMVKRVGSKIASAVGQYFSQKGMSDQLQGYQWEYNLVEDKEANAWCMPGGKVVVYTGILPLTQDETGLAVVLAHEISHAVAKHGDERMSQELLAQFGGAALSAALNSKPQETQQLFMAAYGVGAQVGVLLPFSRQQESEADHLGLIFMAMAGYDPQQAVSFWQRMAQRQNAASPPTFLSDHPSDQQRIANLKNELPEAMKYYKRQ